MVPGSNIESVKKLKLIRIVEKLRETRSPSIWTPVNGKYLDVEVDAKSPPFGRTGDVSHEPDSVCARIRWDSRDRIAQASANQKHRQQEKRTSCDTEQNRQGKTHPHGGWIQMRTRKNAGNQSKKGKK
jgi:hypothetical protein